MKRGSFDNFAYEDLHIRNFLITSTVVALTNSQRPSGPRERGRREPSRSPRSSTLRSTTLRSAHEPLAAHAGHQAEPAQATHSILDRLRACGLKLTPQRMAIVRELAADPSHPTAQELFERLRPSLPTMSFATVYNTLDALAREGLCAALSLSPGASRFDANMEAHNHAVCDRCGLVRDVTPANELPRERVVTSASAAPTHAGGSPLPRGFDVRAVEMIYRGLCADCAKASSPRGKRSLVTERSTKPRR